MFIAGVRAFVLAAVMFSPTTASADWIFTPYLGGVFGGSARFGDVGDREDEFERRITFGGSAGWMGAGIAGFEIDFGMTPNFFQNTTGDADFEFGDSHVTTLMANAVIGVPIGGQTGKGARIYATGGAGLLRANISASDFFDEVSTNDFGFNAGGGVIWFFHDHVGIRGDARYFRSFEDNDPGSGSRDIGVSDFDFWRGTVGVSFRFGG